MADGEFLGSGVKGAGRGSQIGGKLMGPKGAAIGAGVGAVVGLGSQFVKNKKRDEVKSLIPSQEDPTNNARMSEINQIAKNIGAGTDGLTQTGLDDISRSTANTQTKLARVTGGSVGGTVDAMLKAQRVGGRQANQVLGQAQQRLPFFQNLAQNLADSRSQRKLELQLLNRSQVSAENAQDQTDKNINRNNAFVTGEAGAQAQDAKSRIEGLIGAFKNNREGGGVDQSFTNPNDALSQIKVPSVAAANNGESVLGSVNPGGQEVKGLDMLGGSMSNL